MGASTRVWALAEEMTDLRRAAWLLRLDWRVQMPERGDRVRAQQIATLERLAFERLHSDEVGEAIERAEADPSSPRCLKLTALLRKLRSRSASVPSALREEYVAASMLSNERWREAQVEGKYELLVPALERTISLMRQEADCLRRPEESRYDALLRGVEMGVREEDLVKAFRPLEQDFAALAADLPESSPSAYHFPVDAQRRIVEEVLLPRLGLTSDRTWFLSHPKAHPTSMAMAIGDLRITSRFKAIDLSGILYAMHEAGHALYLAGVDEAWERTPLHDGASQALHESQARLWETRLLSSQAFLTFLSAQLGLYIPSLAGAGPQAISEIFFPRCRARYRIESAIGVYDLHIFLRVDLEREIVAGRLEAADLEEAWRERSLALLGFTPSDAREGVLQDPHWARGDYAKFPGYTLGSILASQIWEKAHVELPGLDERLREGNLTELCRWLTETLYRHGRTLEPEEAVQTVAGGPIDPGPYLRDVQILLKE